MTQVILLWRHYGFSECNQSTEFPEMLGVFSSIDNVNKFVKDNKTIPNTDNQPNHKFYGLETRIDNSELFSETVYKLDGGKYGTDM